MRAFSWVDQRSIAAGGSGDRVLEFAKEHPASFSLKGVEVIFHLLLLPYFEELLLRGWFRIGDSDDSRSPKITCN